DTTTSIPSFKISFSRENSFSSLENSSVKSSSVHEDPKVDDTRTSSSSLKASTMEIDMNGRNEKYEDDDYVDNSLALVPLILPETKVAPQIKVVSRSIGEVLDTLRQAKGRIQSSMERRQMIRVGPS
ncbi:hypothetical protein Gohar_011233, partial [Gossypium harknessii]|nr:hypothetical protein [Gossypium harknessii]